MRVIYADFSISERATIHWMHCRGYSVSQIAISRMHEESFVRAVIKCLRRKRT